MLRWWCLLLFACSGAPKLPSEGGDPWVELTSEHFVMWTDATPDRARELVNSMEERRQIVARAMNSASTKTRAFVVAFRNDGELHTYVKWFYGKAFSWTPLLEPMIVVSALGNDDRDNIFTHELTHLISYSIIHHQPHWLAEGIATFFGSATEHGGHVEVGKPRKDLGALVAKRQLTSAAAMLACDSDACIDTPFYATAWALFAFLLNKHPDQLGQYLARLNELPARRRDEAWHDAFPDLTPDKLDHELAAWLAFGDIRLPQFDIELRKDWPITVRALSDAEVRALGALADAVLAGRKDAAAKEIAAAITAEPTNVSARLIQFALDKQITAADARATAAAHPDDWRSWYLVAHATQPGQESADARAKACELAARDPGIETPERLCEH
jgi:hypothetical protein